MKVYSEKLENLNEKLTSSLDSTEHKEELGKLTEDIHDDNDKLDFILDKILVIEGLQKKISERKSEQRLEQSLLSTSNAIENKAATLSIKLPKLEIRSFDGDIFRWKEFWDSFETIIHKNVHLSPVEKLNYLKTKPSGE